MKLTLLQSLIVALSCLVILKLFCNLYLENLLEFSQLETELDLENLKDFTEEDWQLFFKEKEKIYEERRRRVQAYCETQPSNFSIKYKYLFWHGDAGISMCPVNKIGTSTYFTHFGKLGKMDLNHPRWRMNIRERFFPPFQGEMTPLDLKHNLNFR